MFSSCHCIAAAPAFSTDVAWVFLPPSQDESATGFTQHALANFLCVSPSLAMRARTRAASAALYGGGSAAAAGVGGDGSACARPGECDAPLEY